MRIVAVGTPHQPFIHPVMERPVELLLRFQVAAVTKLWLRLLHQELGFLRVMGRVAINATHVVLEVRGSRKITVLFAVGVAGKATFTYLLRGSLLEGEDLRRVAPAFNMLLPGTMAGFAAVPLGTLLRIEGRHEMR